MGKSLNEDVGTHGPITTGLPVILFAMIGSLILGSEIDWFLSVTNTVLSSSLLKYGLY